jgi:lysophospholipase L1-like esterase
VTCDWSASGIEFSATYSSTLQIEAISNAEVAFRVFINEAETGIMTFSSGRSTAEVPGCRQYAEETVTVRLVRITNVESGNYGNMTVLSSLIMDGELLPMMSRGSFIEFVGDSITCGSGLGVPSGFDGSCTYAYLAATELNADYSMISVSGIGVSASTSRHNGRTIGSLYGLTNWYRSQTERYTPTRKADVVVVNLNTNDDSRGATKEQYQKDAKALIAAIRETHGEKVPIVWVVGQMIDANSPVNGWLAEVYAELGGEAAGLYTVTTYKNTSGGAAHPNATSHRDTASALCDLIDQKELLG